MVEIANRKVWLRIKTLNKHLSTAKEATVIFRFTRDMHQVDFMQGEQNQPDDKAPARSYPIPPGPTMMLLYKYSSGYRLCYQPPSNLSVHVPYFLLV